MDVCCLKQILSLALVLTSVVCVSAHKSGVNILQVSGNSPICFSSSLVACEPGNNNENNFEWTSKLVSNIESISHNTISIKESLLNISISESAIPTKNVERKFNCADLRDDGDVLSGVRTIYPYKCCPSYPVDVYCDQDTDGGGWTVIQRRQNLPIREVFYRGWWEYVLGFGNLTGEYWVGLNNIHELTNVVLMELRIDLEDYGSNRKYAKYGVFRIGDTASNFHLYIDRYEGNAGNDLKTWHNNAPFSTFDKDNDESSSRNWAAEYKGGFWYKVGHKMNPNGLPYVGTHASFADGITWHEWHGHYYSLKKTKMMIRPVF